MPEINLGKMLQRTSLKIIYTSALIPSKHHLNSGLWTLP